MRAGPASSLRRLGPALLLLSLLGAPAWAEAGLVPPPGAGPAATLQAARAKLAKASSPADFASTLDALSTDLSPSDSLALLNESLASVAPALRKPLLVKAAGLSLLTGLFVEAAARYEEAAAPVQGPGPGPGSGADASLLLHSARCYLAAGDPEKASELGDRLLAADPAYSASARLVLAWSRLLQSRGGEARTLALELLGAKDGVQTGERREAAFLEWLSSTAEEKAQAASALLAEFPGSPEALIASGAVAPPPLPHWYLGGLALAPAPSPAAPPPPSPAPPSAANPGAGSPKSNPVGPQSSAGGPQSNPGSPAQAKRLQVGYFSTEQNAEALKTELSAKHFAASIETITRTSGDGKRQESRWIVVVEGGKDLAKTRQALKDAGYESYLID